LARQQRRSLLGDTRISHGIEDHFDRDPPLYFGNSG